jgi:prophage DNA circulation protein
LSGILGTLASIAPSSQGTIGSPTWLRQLLPASFRGVPFNVESHEENSGRRGVLHEFPGRDTPSAEDLGRKGGVYRVRAFVLGDDYMAQRDALRQAVRGDGSTGTLVHPYLGNIQVKPALMRMREQIAPAGIAQFDLEFWEDGQQPSPISGTDTASALLAGIASALTIAKRVYSYATLIASNPAILGALVTTQLESFGGTFLGSLGLPPSLLSSVVQMAGSLGGDPEDTAATATAVANLASSAAALVVAQTASANPAVAQALAASAIAALTAQATSSVLVGGLPSSLVATAAVNAAAVSTALATAQAVQTTATDDPVAGTPLVPPPPVDPSLGLAALAAWTAPTIASAVAAGTVPAMITLPQNQAAAAATVAATQALVQGCFTCAVAQVYASIDWVDKQAAEAAGEQLQTLIETQLETASAAHQDDLAMAWRGMMMLAANDSYQRAQALPSLVDYSLNAALPAAVLAQRFYRDGTRASQLAQLNSVWHAGWMPPAGVALAA